MVVFAATATPSRTGKEPLVVSEFGNWGLPELPQPLPWWFPRDFDGRAITRPAGLFDRFKALGFSRLFPDYAALAQGDAVAAVPEPQARDRVDAPPRGRFAAT